MSMRRSRRRFLKETASLAVSASLGASLWAAPQEARNGERIRLGIVGVANRGRANLDGVAHEEIVALCDVDENNAVEVRKRFPKAAYYSDYRVMLDKQKDLQAVVISTPDHHHAFAAMPAMQLGKHVYCEKPLAHSVYEVRRMMETAAKTKVVTQMGTQIHATDNYRRVVEVIQSGILGSIRKVSVWCNKQPDGGFRGKERPVPSGLNYDLWVGPAPFRSYPPIYMGDRPIVHHHWRWWWEYGGGVLADMACHYMDLAHWALGLRWPTSVAATGRVIHKGDNDMPDLMQVDFDYSARGNQPPVQLTWYHGQPGPDLDGKITHRAQNAIGRPGKPQAHTFGSGVLFEGEKGNLLADYTHLALLPEDRFRTFELPRETIPRSIGHHREWLEAIRTGGTTTCNFDYSGALAETVLLGNVAYRAGARIQYDAKTGRVTNNSKAEQYLRREYRKGWTL